MRWNSFTYLAKIINARAVASTAEFVLHDVGIEYCDGFREAHNAIDSP
jgi:hypothetical protein